MKHSIGVYGMGTMGKNIALNIASKGHSVAVFNRDYEKTKHIVKECFETGISQLNGYSKLNTFIESLEKPRKILIMVKSGTPVENIIDDLITHIDINDIIIDGGNEWYENTEMRQEYLYYAYGINLIGMGISGGANGARYGPSLMPSGCKDAFDSICPLLESIAAKKKDNSVCMTYIGSGGSGHYVKMVHNGIEYGIMQVIAEIYDVLKNMKYTNEMIASLFEKINNDIHSYLIEITIEILRKKDENDEYILDKILDLPKMNGTGIWTSKEGLEVCIPVPSIQSAVDARIISSNKHLRTKLHSKIKLKHNNNSLENISEDFISQCIITCMFICYLQGFLLIRHKNNQKQWNINCNTIADIWQGGCIIRSNILDYFKYIDISKLEENAFSSIYIKNGIEALSNVVSMCSCEFIPISTISSSYQYILQYIQLNNPSNLIQAQRDYFGSHGYQIRNGQ